MEMLSTAGMHFDNKTDQGTGKNKGTWGKSAGPEPLKKLGTEGTPATHILPNITTSLNIARYYAAQEIAENGQGHQRLLPNDNTTPQNE